MYHFIILFFALFIPHTAFAGLSPDTEWRYNDFNHHCVDASGKNALDPDSDGDDFADWIDTCATVSDPDQADRDGDHIGDACDFCPTQGVPQVAACDFGEDGRLICPEAPAENIYDCLDQSGTDSYPQGAHSNAEFTRIIGVDGCLISCADVYTSTSFSRLQSTCPCEPGDEEHCICDPTEGRFWVTFITTPNGEDSDDDTIVDRSSSENCRDQENRHLVTFEYDFRDRDEDGIGDVCDKCPFHYDPDPKDGDNDDVPDACDNCINVANNHEGDHQKDTDCDGIGDACDENPDVADVSHARHHDRSAADAASAADEDDSADDSEDDDSASANGTGAFNCQVATNASAGPLSSIILFLYIVIWALKKRTKLS